MGFNVTTRFVYKFLKIKIKQNAIWDISVTAGVLVIKSEILLITMVSFQVNYAKDMFKGILLSSFTLAETHAHKEMSQSAKWVLEVCNLELSVQYSETPLSSLPPFL